MPAASSAGPDEDEPEEPVGAATGSDDREAAEVPPPYTCLTCGCDINGGGVLCLMPGCGGVAKSSPLSLLRVAGRPEVRFWRRFFTTRKVHEDDTLRT